MEHRNSVVTKEAADRQRPTEAQLKWAQFHRRRKAQQVNEIVTLLWNTPASVSDVADALPEDGNTTEETQDHHDYIDNGSHNSTILRSDDGRRNNGTTKNKKKPKISRGRRALLRVSKRAFSKRKKEIEEYGFCCVLSSGASLSDEEEENNEDDALAAIFAGAWKKKRRKNRKQRRNNNNNNKQDDEERIRRFENAFKAMMINLAAATQQPPEQTIEVPTKIWSRPEHVPLFTTNYDDLRWGFSKRKESSHNQNALHATNKQIAASFPMDRGASWLMHLPARTMTKRPYSVFASNPVVAIYSDTQENSNGSEEKNSSGKQPSRTGLPGRQKFNSLVAMLQQQMVQPSEEMTKLRRKADESKRSLNFMEALQSHSDNNHSNTSQKVSQGDAERQNLLEGITIRYIAEIKGVPDMKEQVYAAQAVTSQYLNEISSFPDRYGGDNNHQNHLAKGGFQTLITRYLASGTSRSSEVGKTEDDCVPDCQYRKQEASIIDVDSDDEHGLNHSERVIERYLAELEDYAVSNGCKRVSSRYIGALNIIREKRHRLTARRCFEKLISTFDIKEHTSSECTDRSNSNFISSGVSADGERVCHHMQTTNQYLESLKFNSSTTVEEDNPEGIAAQYMAAIKGIRDVERLRAARLGFSHLINRTISKKTNTDTTYTDEKGKQHQQYHRQPKNNGRQHQETVSAGGILDMYQPFRKDDDNQALASIPEVIATRYINAIKQARHCKQFLAARKIFQREITTYVHEKSNENDESSSTSTDVSLTVAGRELPSEKVINKYLSVLEGDNSGGYDQSLSDGGIAAQYISTVENIQSEETRISARESFERLITTNFAGSMNGNELNPSHFCYPSSATAKDNNEIKPLNRYLDALKNGNESQSQANPEGIAAQYLAAVRGIPDERQRKLARIGFARYMLQCCCSNVKKFVPESSYTDRIQGIISNNLYFDKENEVVENSRSSNQHLAASSYKDDSRGGAQDSYTINGKQIYSSGKKDGTKRHLATLKADVSEDGRNSSAGHELKNSTVNNDSLHSPEWITSKYLSSIQGVSDEDKLFEALADFKKMMANCYTPEIGEKKDDHKHVTKSESITSSALVDIPTSAMSSEEEQRHKSFHSTATRYLTSVKEMSDEKQITVARQKFEKLVSRYTSCETTTIGSGRKEQKETVIEATVTSMRTKRMMSSSNDRVVSKYLAALKDSANNNLEDSNSKRKSDVIGIRDEKQLSAAREGFERLIGNYITEKSSGNSSEISNKIEASDICAAPPDSRIEESTMADAKQPHTTDKTMRLKNGQLKDESFELIATHFLAEVSCGAIQDFKQLTTARKEFECMVSNFTSADKNEQGSVNFDNVVEPQERAMVVGRYLTVLKESASTSLSNYEKKHLAEMTIGIPEEELLDAAREGFEVLITSYHADNNKSEELASGRISHYTGEIHKGCANTERNELSLTPQNGFEWLLSSYNNAGRDDDNGIINLKQYDEETTKDKNKFGQVEDGSFKVVATRFLAEVSAGVEDLKQLAAAREEFKYLVSSFTSAGMDIATGEGYCKSRNVFDTNSHERNLIVCRYLSALKESGSTSLLNHEKGHLAESILGIRDEVELNAVREGFELLIAGYNAEKCDSANIWETNAERKQINSTPQDDFEWLIEAYNDTGRHGVDEADASEQYNTNAKNAFEDEGFEVVATQFLAFVSLSDIQNSEEIHAAREEFEYLVSCYTSEENDDSGTATDNVNKQERIMVVSRYLTALKQIASSSPSKPGKTCLNEIIPEGQLDAAREGFELLISSYNVENNYSEKFTANRKLLNDNGHQYNQHARFEGSHSGEFHEKLHGIGENESNLTPENGFEWLIATYNNVEESDDDEFVDVIEAVKRAEQDDRTSYVDVARNYVTTLTGGGSYEMSDSYITTAEEKLDHQSFAAVATRFLGDVSNIIDEEQFITARKHFERLVSRYSTTSGTAVSGSSSIECSVSRKRAPLASGGIVNKYLVALGESANGFGSNSSYHRTNSSAYLDEIKGICGEKQLAAARVGFENLMDSYRQTESSSKVGEELFTPPRYQAFVNWIASYEEGINFTDESPTEIRSGFSKGDESSTAKKLVSRYLSTTVKRGSSRQQGESLPAFGIPETSVDDGQHMYDNKFMTMGGLHDGPVVNRSYDEGESLGVDSLDETESACFSDFFQRMRDVKVEDSHRQLHHSDSQSVELSLRSKSFESNSGLSTTSSNFYGADLQQKRLFADEYIERQHVLDPSGQQDTVSPTNDLLEMTAGKVGGMLKKFAGNGGIKELPDEKDAANDETTSTISFRMFQDGSRSPRYFNKSETSPLFQDEGNGTYRTSTARSPASSESPGSISSNRSSSSRSFATEFSPERVKDFHQKVMEKSALIGNKDAEHSIIDTDGTTSEASNSGMDNAMISSLLLSPEILNKRLHQAVRAIERRSWDQVSYLLSANPWLAEMTELTTGQYLLHKLALYGAGSMKVDGDVTTFGPACPRDLNLDLVRMFPVSVHKFDQDGNLPLHMAAAAGNLSMIKLLGDRFPSGASVRNEDGMLPLHLSIMSSAFPTAAGFGDAKSVVKALLGYFPGAVAVIDNEGNLPLHSAINVLSGEIGIDVVHMLLDEASRQVQSPTGVRFYNRVKADKNENDCVVAAESATAGTKDGTGSADEIVHCTMVVNDLGETPLLAAIHNAAGWKMIEAIASGPGGNQAAIWKDATMNNALHLLVGDNYEDPAAALSILKVAPEAACVRNGEGMLPIEIASRQMLPVEVILALVLVDLPIDLDENLTVNCRDHNGDSWWFLTCECRDEYVDVVEDVLAICSHDQIRELCLMKRKSGGARGTVISNATFKSREILRRALRFLTRYEFADSSPVHSDASLGLHVFDALDYGTKESSFDEGRQVYLMCYARKEAYSAETTLLQQTEFDFNFVEEVLCHSVNENEQFCVAIERPDLSLDEVVTSMLKNKGCQKHTNIRLRYVGKVFMVLREIVEGMGHIHYLGIVHGNLSLQTCCKYEDKWKLSKTLEMHKIGDLFDFTRFGESAPPEAVEPSSNGAQGHQVSFRTNLSVEPSIDIWAFGKLAYEVLVGTPLFDFDTDTTEIQHDHRALNQIMQWSDDDVENARHSLREVGISALGADLITKCLAPEPEKRPSSVWRIMDHDVWDEPRLH